MLKRWVCHCAAVIGKGYAWSMWALPPLALMLIGLHDYGGWDTYWLVVTALAIYCGPIVILGMIVTVLLCACLTWEAVKLLHSCLQITWFRRAFLLLVMVCLVPVSQVAITEIGLGGPFPMRWQEGGDVMEFWASIMGLGVGNPWAWLVAGAMVLLVRICLVLDRRVGNCPKLGE